MAQFVIYWLNGTKDYIEGDSGHDAFVKAGYGNGATRAVDFVGHKADEGDYEWSQSERSWINTRIRNMK